jgi:hypothetical protein
MFSLDAYPGGGSLRAWDAVDLYYTHDCFSIQEFDK